MSNLDIIKTLEILKDIFNEQKNRLDDLSTHESDSTEVSLTNKLILAQLRNFSQEAEFQILVKIKELHNLE